MTSLDDRPIGSKSQSLCSRPPQKPIADILAALLFAARLTQVKSIHKLAS
ncbi:hypothetical protein [Leptolyngbya ohadii]|nr:hypothetical protein [Leptolyngbya ohadii]